MLSESRWALIGLLASTAACSRTLSPRAGNTPTDAWIDLRTTDSDVWARERTLRGTASPTCAQVVVVCRDDGDVCAPSPVARDGAAFVSHVALGSGANELEARCELADGRAITSTHVVWTVRPELDALTDAAPARAPHEPAPWIEGAVVYGAVPHLFAETDGLRAIERRLDALHDVGIDTLWLAPIHPSPGDDYGYAVLDHFAVREEIGGVEALRSLIAAAHARGMRVLMDFVPNHVSAEHPYFAHAEAHGERSPYWDFFERDDEGEPTHYFDWENLPNLDYDHPEVRAMIRAAFAHWARDLDVDGFRVDAAWGVMARAPDFFRALADELHAIDPDLLLIAEASARDEAWRDTGFAAAYDWSDDVGHWAWERAFADDDVDVDALRASIAGERTPFGVLRFVDNNDTAARFRTRRGAPAYAAMTALLFALPGIPALFTGDDIGAEYLPYEQVTPLEIDRDDARARAAGAVLARRIALRRAEPLLRRGELAMVDVEPSGAVLAFVRRDPERALPPVLVVIELDGRPVVARLRLAPDDASALGLDAGRAHLVDRLSGEQVRTTRRGAITELSLSAHGARVLGVR